jgi:tRNA pseudouridine38-40 synthase
MRLLFTIQYLGTHYAGWQRQSNAISVQEVVETALSELCKQPMRVEGAGRTDAGVHALAQRAHADLPIAADSRGIILGVNNLLPHDIRIVAARPVAGDFHCRFAPSSKSYRYAIWNDPVADVFHFETSAHVAQPLDADRMDQAAAMLVGRHDFRAFTVLAPEVSSTVRTISRAAARRDGRGVLFTVEADGFLRFMVRRIAGLLIEIGRGRLPVESLGDALEPRFEPSRWAAPAKGLTLVEITYSDLGSGPDSLC